MNGIMGDQPNGNQNSIEPRSMRLSRSQFPPLPIPSGSGYTGGRDRNGSMNGRQPNFDLARSPPNPAGSNKNTKHVPCKFFRSGQCQAGNACPFLHTMDPQMHQAPCKYFLKGNCKFGAKCALAHYLPNGHRVTKADLNAAYTNGRYGGTEPYAYQPEPVLEPQPYPAVQYNNFYPGPDMQFLHDDEELYRQSYTNGDNFDVQSPVLSNYGSPTNETSFPRSSIDKVRSALNAPLPNSFNPHSLSNIAKHGPMGSSVPTGFLRSPPSTSLSTSIVGATSKEPNIWATIGLHGKTPSPFSSSVVKNESANPPRILRSERNRPARQPIMSASVPSRDWGAASTTETDLIPTDLHEDVLTPQERARRSEAEQELSSSAKDREGLAIPRRSSNAGAQTLVGSPSRFKAMFEEQKRDKETKMAVGSPLRESWFSNESTNTAVRAGAQISGITQAMSRVELNRADPNESTSVTNGMRTPSSGIRSSAFSRLDRTISSPAIRPQRIDEGFEGGLFEMDDESMKKSHWPDNQSSNAESKQTSGAVPRNGLGNNNKPMFGSFRPG